MKFTSIENNTLECNLDYEALNFLYLSLHKTFGENAFQLSIKFPSSLIKISDYVFYHKVPDISNLSVIGYRAFEHS